MTQLVITGRVLPGLQKHLPRCILSCHNLPIACASALALCSYCATYTIRVRLCAALSKIEYIHFLS